ncbi:MAG: hypothetical protein AAF449_03050 [Myxococcota bacterium]
MRTVQAICVVWAVAMATCGVLSEMNRSMLGFPDGTRGPAENIAEVTYLGVTLGSVCIAVGSMILTWSRFEPRMRWRGLVVCIVLGVLLLSISLSAEAVLRRLYPSVGG